LLAHHLLECMGAPFTRQNLIAHRTFGCREDKALRQNANTNGGGAVTAMAQVAAKPGITD
jgi:hypothetical protein